MITVKLGSGMGNQMFQYAAGRALADRLRSDLLLDISEYDDPRQGRNFMLNCFDIRAKIGRRGLSFWPRGRYFEKQFPFDRKVLTLPDNTILEGYWQSYNYFADDASEIRKDFSFKTLPAGQNVHLLELINNTHSIAVHIRRTDYATKRIINQKFGTCPMEYYQKAVNLISKKVKQPSFFIFSDDPNFCRTNLGFIKKAILVTGNNITSASEDLRLMIACKHQIIANSTFSWWAAWLNYNHNKIVVTPKKWFAQLSINTHDLIPKQWQRL